MDFSPSNFIVIQLQFSAFSPHPRLIPRPLHLPPISTTPPHPVIVHVSFIIVPTNPSPFPLNFPPLSPLVTVSLFFLSNMDGSGQHYAKWNKPGGEGQIPYDLTYKWNLINKTNKQAKYNQRH